MPSFSVCVCLCVLFSAYLSVCREHGIGWPIKMCLVCYRDVRYVLAYTRHVSYCVSKLTTFAEYAHNQIHTHTLRLQQLSISSFFVHFVLLLFPNINHSFQCRLCRNISFKEKVFFLASLGFFYLLVLCGSSKLLPSALRTSARLCLCLCAFL